MGKRWLRGGAETVPDTERLAPIRIFTSELELDGYVAPAGQRITDILLRGQDLAFLPAGADAVPENWISISPPEILIAAPPPLPAGSARHANGEQRAVAIRIERYIVAGTAHTGAGGQSVMQPFLPLTDAELTRDGAQHERYAVLIVNTTRTTPHRS